jgi:hypothetical protein
MTPLAMSNLKSSKVMMILKILLEYTTVEDRTVV